MNFDDGVHAAVEETAAEILGPWLPQVRAVTRRAPWDTVLAEPVELAVGDLLELATQDPAAGGSWELVLRTYRAYRAVLVYRLAHALLEHGGREGPAETLARRLSEQAKVETGVELHPAARIGPRFMVDHGYGTVVGETAVLGSDCYLLQGVVLGSIKIHNNPSSKRHPTLGDRVGVGAFASIFGPVVIGDDVLIGAHAFIKHDVPDGACVSVLHQYQVVTGSAEVAVSGVEPAGVGRFLVHGAGLHDPELRVEQLTRDRSAQAAVLERASERLLVELPETVAAAETRLRLSGPGGSSVTVALPRARLARDAGGRHV
ncbi:serine O-acetyltransferase [Nonomuraea rubra]